MAFRTAARTDAEQTRHRQEQAEWARLMGAGEQVSSTYRLGRCILLFTNRRLILADESLTGRRVEYSSLPYRSISSFTVDASGPFSAEADLSIWVVGRTAPVERQFAQGVDVYAVQALLAQHTATN